MQHEDGDAAGDAAQVQAHLPAEAMRDRHGDHHPDDHRGHRGEQCPQSMPAQEDDRRRVYNAVQILTLELDDSFDDSAARKRWTSGDLGGRKEAQKAGDSRLGAPRWTSADGRSGVRLSPISTKAPRNLSLPGRFSLPFVPKSYPNPDSCPVASSSEDQVHHRSSRFMHARDDVALGAQGDVNIGVPQHLGDKLHIDPATEQERRSGMA